MATDTAITKPARNPANQFRSMAKQIAGSMLTDWVGTERAGEATGRISAALAAAAASAKDPSDFYDCTPQSIGQCIAVAALTEIMPGTGAAALAYVVPQRARKGEPPQLQFMFSHRGLNALARRTGQTMIAVPVGHKDELDFSPTGDVIVRNRDIDNPPSVESELRGVLLTVQEIGNGQVTCRQFVPKKLIDKRRASSRAGQNQYGPWSNWYVEMAMKTAMHYAIARGWCVIDDAAATRALSVEQQQDLVVVQPRVIEHEPDDRTPSEALADKLEGKAEPAQAEQLSPEAEYLARIDAAATIEEQNAIANDIEADLQDGTLTGSEASNLKKLLMDKAEG